MPMPFAPPQGPNPILNQANTWSKDQRFGSGVSYGYASPSIGGSSYPFVGVWDNGNGNYYGIVNVLGSLPAHVIALGGYYAGLGIQGSTNNIGQPIFGVLNSGQGAQNVAFLVYDTNQVKTFNNVLDDGIGNRKTSPATTKLAGTTAGNVYWAQPEQGTRKVFIASVVAYENDTATSQQITFPTAYSYTPGVSVNTTGLTVDATTTTLTISAPDATTVYNGVIEVVGI